MTNLPFKPEKYRIWRNYARVFKVLGLATSINNKLRCTDLCRKIVCNTNEFMTYDEYIHYLLRIFYYPSPIFINYDINEIQKFPFCAILKLLISRIGTNNIPKIEIKEVLELLISNNVTGIENISYYKQLKPKICVAKTNQKRQIREMLIFISQLSYLSWNKNALFIDSFALANLS